MPPDMDPLNSARLSIISAKALVPSLEEPKKMAHLEARQTTYN
jgi:hypothetical protein